jgi:hypothetical protein
MRVVLRVAIGSVSEKHEGLITRRLLSTQIARLLDPAARPDTALPLYLASRSSMIVQRSTGSLSI